MSKPSDNFVRFLSCVPGVQQSRYGTRTSTGGNNLIGAKRDPKTRQVEWMPEMVMALPERDAQRYRREYDRAVKSGALRERSAADYDKYMAECLRKEQAAREAAEKAAKGPQQPQTDDESQE